MSRLSDVCRMGMALAIVSTLTVVAEDGSAQQVLSRRQSNMTPREFDDCGGADWCPRMVILAPEGDRGAHVTTFAAAKYPITFDQWDACARGGGCRSNPWPDDNGWGRGQHPVSDVSWFDAQEYVTWLSSATRHSYRLLSRAEWQYVARGIPKSQLWNADSGRHSPGVVSSTSANEFGLHGVGSILEWVQDCEPSEKGLLPRRYWETYACRRRQYGVDVTAGSPSDRGAFYFSDGDRIFTPRGFRVARWLDGNHPVELSDRHDDKIVNLVCTEIDGYANLVDRFSIDMTTKSYSATAPRDSALTTWPLTGKIFENTNDIIFGGRPTGALAGAIVGPLGTLDRTTLILTDHTLTSADLRFQCQTDLPKL